MKRIICCSILFIVSYIILFTANAFAKFELIQAKGIVNRNEIGGDGLRIVSLWADKSQALISKDGSFATVISNQRAQKLFLTDNNKKLRALAICLPKDADNIVFDARSTAMAILFDDPRLFGQDKDVERMFALIEQNQSFKMLVVFLRDNLSGKSIEELLKDEKCMALLDECNKEIFGQDRKAIMSSLYAAQDKLQKALH